MARHLLLPCVTNLSSSYSMSFCPYHTLQTIAMCHLHYKLAKKSPGVTEPPTSEKVSEMLREFDFDQSGALTEDEFQAFAAKWFNCNGAVFARNLLVTSFIAMVVLPESAAILHRELPIARQIPKAVFKVLFGIGTSRDRMRLRASIFYVCAALS